ncbi:M96 mating-specific protein family [Phytophthora cinnamomi]|uniref:M96 mating-specific protein family n=1 Tax=Phytophthora cinnamomi TaxID=4785 RepID=UPI0035599224|nr:M96 mating-specific protein family [Phytophthora cinnamomi]
MALLQDTDDLDVLDAALSFMDAYMASAAPASGHRRGDSSEEDVMSLGGDLDELLMATLSPSSGESRDEPSALDDARARRHRVLPSPLAPLATNVQAPDVAGVKGNGRLRGGCRGSTCQAACVDADATKDKAKKRAKVNPNRARNERKNELAYLRTKVKQMEIELGALHQRHRGGSTALTVQPTAPLQAKPPAAVALVQSNSASSAGTLPPFWRDMATRQKLRREKSERENARLKLVLEGQIKLARSMESLLQKRARQQVSECAGYLCPNGAQGRTLEFLADKSTFDALLASIDAAYLEVDEVFAATGLADSETPSRDARMREGANGMYLDINSNKLLPFSMEAVGTAVWNHFKGADKHRGAFYEKAAKALESSDDTVMEDFKMEFMGKTTRANFRVKQVLRRYVEADREVVVSLSSVHSLDDSKSRLFAGLGFAEKSYVVIKRPKSLALQKGGFTVLQMCSLVVPQKADSCEQDATAVGAFTEFVLNVIVANTTVSQERIENVLLDQTLKRSRME